MLYFDNASTTYPKFDVLYDETMKIYREVGINFNRNSSKKSNSAGEIKENLVSNLRKIFSAPKHYVILNSSATFSLNEIITGLDYSKIKNIYISPFEHNSVYRVLKKIEREKGINIEILKFNEFELDSGDMKLKFLSKKPDLIISTHASNVFGNIVPVEEVFSEGKKYNAITVLDSAQTGGVFNFEKISSFCDFIVFAGHKNLYGPSGIGGYLYNGMPSLNPLLYGGTGIKSEDLEMPEDIPERFEAGSPNILGIIGLELTTSKILQIGIDEMHNKKIKNFEKLYDLLKEYDYDLKIESKRENNIGVISVTGVDFSPKELEGFFNEYGVTVRTGMHCAPLAHKHMETDGVGTVRLSVGYFNEDKNFEDLREVLDRIF